MSAGYSGTFSIGGVEISCPTEARWMERELIGYDGIGRPIYPAIGEFEMYWNLISTSELKKLIDAATSSLTGSVAVDLPQWAHNNYIFKSYSGTYANRPAVGRYFIEYVEEVRMTISNIRTD